MKIAVYTICKNEEQFVRRWYESSKDANYHILTDTGSTDNTVELAKSLGITVHQIALNPFRFDDARNASLNLIPADVDYCIALDVDEVLAPGWREALNEAFAEGIDRPLYRRIEAFDEHGNPKSEFNGFKVHRRFGIRWHYPIHEVPHWYDPSREEVQKYIEGFEIHHHQDVTKSRGQYLPLLEMAVKENPDARNLYYLGREQCTYGQFEESAKNLKAYLEKSKFKQEMSAACRMLSKCEPKNAEEWLIRGTEEWPCRESYLALANWYYTEQEWDACLLVAKKALQFTQKPMEFLAENWAWGEMADDLIAISSWQLGDYETALHHGRLAAQAAPHNQRLQDNVTFYESKVNNANTEPDGLRGTD